MLNKKYWNKLHKRKMESEMLANKILKDPTYRKIENLLDYLNRDFEAEFQRIGPNISYNEKMHDVYDPDFSSIDEFFRSMDSTVFVENYFKDLNVDQLKNGVKKVYCILEKRSVNNSVDYDENIKQYNGIKKKQVEKMLETFKPINLNQRY